MRNENFFLGGDSVKATEPRQEHRLEEEWIWWRGELEGVEGSEKNQDVLYKRRFTFN